MKTIVMRLRIFSLLVSITSATIGIGQAIGATASVPAAVEKGMQLLKSAGPLAAFEAWREGGVLDETGRGDEVVRFKAMAKPLGNYRSYEVIEVKEIGKTSKILYLSMTFERGVIYGSFLVWKSDRDWVVQRREFNARPEVVLPWLTSGGPRGGG
jgi:hypothetical protein